MKKQVLVATGLVAISAVAAYASFNNLNSGFASDVYDIAVEQILKVPIGFVCGLLAMVFGAMAAIRAQIMLAIPAILGGAAVLNADTIINSMGALI